MSVFDFIDHLQSTGVLPEKVTAKLRKQLQASSKSVTPEKLADLLIKKGVFDKATAKKAITAFHNSVADNLDLLDDELELLDDEPIVDESEIVEAEMDLMPLDDVEAELMPLDEDEADLMPKDDKPVVVTSKRKKPVDAKTSAVNIEESLGGDDDHAAELPDDSLASTVSTKRRRRYRGNRWDSPLMLVGGGALLLMLFAGGGIWFYLTQGTADEAFQAADADYQAENYMQSVNKFEQFVDDFSNNEKASLARVRIGMAKIWNVAGRKDWDAALNQVRSELPKVLTEEAFDEARPELATILPNIMEGFAVRAQEAEETADAQSNLDLANQAHVEVQNSNYLPARFQRNLQNKVDSIQSIMKTVERRINRDKDLDKRLEEIQSSVASGDTGSAYAIQSALLREYPGLESNEKLQEAILAIAKKEQESVGALAEMPRVDNAPLKKIASRSVVLASRRGPQEAKTLQGNAVFVKARGAVYGLDAANGAVLWRHFVGFETNDQPVPTGREVDRDVLVVDARSNELMRLNGRNGSLVWRLPCPGKISVSSVDRGSILVSCAADNQGWLMTVNIEDGSVKNGATFPMALTSAATIDERKERIVQPGTHSNVFVLSPDTLACTGVAYLGHGENTIAVPPVSLLDHVLVAENPGADFSLIHVLRPDPENPGAMQKAMDPVRLVGQIVTPMIPFGRRVLVSTNRGALNVFELDPKQDPPLKPAVDGINGSNDDPSTRHVFFDRNRVWVGGTDLTRYDLQTARGSISQKWIHDKGDRFLGPIQQLGDVLFHVRQRQGRLGATVTAIRAASRSDDGDAIWNTDLGVPPVGEVFVNLADKQFNVVNANAELFSLGIPDLNKPVVDQFSANAVTTSYLQESVSLGNDTRAFFGKPTDSQYVLYDNRSTPKLQIVQMNLGGDEPTTVPVVFGKSLVVPTSSGTVYLVNPKTGNPSAHEFQPTLTVGEKINWPRPAVENESIFLADGGNRMFQVGLQQKRLEIVKKAETDLRPKGMLAFCGASIFATQEGISSDELIAFNAQDLKSTSNTWPVEGHVNWGPKRIGDFVIVTSDASDLVCLDAKQTERWRVKLAYGPIAGPPLLVGNTLTFTSIRGVVWQVNAQTGEEKQAKIELREPIGTGPMQFGKYIVVVGSDGILHLLSMPAA